MIRTYELKHSANARKLKEVVKVIRAYRKLAESIAKEQWILFYRDGRFRKNWNIKHIPTMLSARYKQTCQYQVTGMLDSFISNRKNDFVSAVRCSSLDETLKHKLFIINVFCMWQKTAPFTHLKSRLEIDLDTLKLARKIFKHVLSLHRKPRMSYINMALDSKVGLISDREKDKAKLYDYWIRVSTLTKGHPVYIPLMSNDYYANIQGRRNNFVQINLSPQEEVSFSFVKDVPACSDYLPLLPKLSLDLGFATLFASNKGDLWGRSFFAVLKKYDVLIANLAGNRQRQGLKTRSPRYNQLVGNIREYIKNEINRVLNRAVDIYKPAELVVELLDFRSPDLSRRMNRLISMFGKSIVSRKLESLSLMYGIKITETNPAYSSQECSVCGYVEKNNRATQSEFKCKCCNTGLHADVNAARNHLDRSSDKVIDVYKSTKSVLHILTERFLSDMEHTIRHYRMAPGLLSSNPYFAGPLAQPKGFS